jgi:hypothetical protein
MDQSPSSLVPDADTIQCEDLMCRHDDLGSEIESGPSVESTKHYAGTEQHRVDIASLWLDEDVAAWYPRPHIRRGDSQRGTSSNASSNNVNGEAHWPVVVILLLLSVAPQLASPACSIV